MTTPTPQVVPHFDLAMFELVEKIASETIQDSTKNLKQTILKAFSEFNQSIRKADNSILRP